MGVHTKCLGSLCLILLLLTVSIATAASRDLRLVDAMAERNTALVHVLPAEGVDVNTARADGATALLWATHWDDGEATELLLRAGAHVNAARRSSMGEVYKATDTRLDRTVAFEERTVKRLL